MEPRTRKLAGWAVAAVGAVIALVGVLADSLGIGEGDEVGGKQVAALIAGIVVLAVGVLVAVLSGRGTNSPTTSE